MKKIMLAMLISTVALTANTYAAKIYFENLGYTKLKVNYRLFTQDGKQLSADSITVPGPGDYQGLSTAVDAPKNAYLVIIDSAAYLDEKDGTVKTANHYPSVTDPNLPVEGLCEGDLYWKTPEQQHNAVFTFGAAVSPAIACSSTVFDTDK